MNEFYQDQHYDIRQLSFEQLKELFRYCAEYASSIRVDKLSSIRRERTDISFDEYMNSIIGPHDHHTFIYRKGRIDQKNDPFWNESGHWTIEVGSCTLGKMPDYFLFINIPETEIDHIVNKFNLKPYA